MSANAETTQPLDPVAAGRFGWIVVWAPLAVLTLLAWPIGRLDAVLPGKWLGNLADDPYPHLRGAALVAVCGMLCGLHVLESARQVRVSGLALFGLALAFGAARFGLAELSDTFAAKAALTLGAGSLALIVAGASMTERARETFGRGLMAISVLVAGRALAGPLLGDDHFAGVIGNTGPVSQAALPGALIGLASLLGPQRLRTGLATRLLALAAIGTFLAHAGLAPVLAGGVCFALAAGTAAARTPSGLRAGFAAAALVGLAVAAAPNVDSSDAPTSADPTLELAEVTGAPSAGGAGNLGGARVRLSLWRRAYALLRVHPWGVGPGQLQAQYPRFRDEAERTASDLSAGGPTEVEHLHNDPLQALAELGLLGGGAWVLALLLAGLSCWRLLGDPNAGARGPLALGLLGLLANACLHTPFTVQPLAALIGALLLGNVLARPASPLPPLVSSLQRCAPIVALATFPFVLQLSSVGWAMTNYVRATRTIAERLEEVDGQIRTDDTVLRDASLTVRRALDRALDVAPDATPALFCEARLSLQASAEERIAAWNAVRVHRPYSWEAAMGLSRAYDAAGQPTESRAMHDLAMQIAPGR